MKLNVDGAGNYRVRYDDKSWDVILRTYQGMSEPDRVNLLSDQWALVEASLAPWKSYKDLIRLLPSPTELADREQIIGVFDLIDRLLDDTKEREAFRNDARAILRPTFDALGPEVKPGEPPRWTNLRASVITALGDLGDPDIKAECQKRFLELCEGKKYSPDMRRAVLLVTGRYADEKTWNKLHELGLATTNIGEKQDFYEALAHATDPALAKRTLQLALTDELATSRAIYLVGHVARYSGHPELAWAFARDNMNALTTKLDTLGAQSFLPGLFMFFSEPAQIDELNQFAKAHPALANPREIAKAVDEIEVRAELKKRLPARSLQPRRRPTRSPQLRRRTKSSSAFLTRKLNGKLDRSRPHRGRNKRIGIASEESTKPCRRREVLRWQNLGAIGQKGDTCRKFFSRANLIACLQQIGAIAISRS